MPVSQTVERGSANTSGNTAVSFSPPSGERYYIDRVDWHSDGNADSSTYSEGVRVQIGLNGRSEKHYNQTNGQDTGSNAIAGSHDVDQYITEEETLNVEAWHENGASGSTVTATVVLRRVE